MLESINRLRGAITQGEEQKVKLTTGLAHTNREIARIKKLLGERAVFETKCIDLQKAKLVSLIDANKKEVIIDAEKRANDAVTKDPSAYSTQQIANMKYVNYQQNIGRFPKIAERIAANLISKWVFVEPIFDNPFKEETL